MSNGREDYGLPQTKPSSMSNVEWEQTVRGITDPQTEAERQRALNLLARYTTPSTMPAPSSPSTPTPSPPVTEPEPATTEESEPSTTKDVRTITFTPGEFSARYTGTLSRDEQAEMNWRLLGGGTTLRKIGERHWETPEGQEYREEAVGEIAGQLKSENILNISAENIRRAVEMGTTEPIGERLMTAEEKEEAYREAASQLSGQLIEAGFGEYYSPERIEASLFSQGPLKYSEASGIRRTEGSATIIGPEGRVATIDISGIETQLAAPVQVSISGAKVKEQALMGLGERMQPQTSTSFFVEKYGRGKEQLEGLLEQKFAEFKREAGEFLSPLPEGTRTTALEKARIGEPFRATPAIHESVGTYYPDMLGGIAMQRAQRWTDINRFLAYGESWWYRLEELLPDIPIIEPLIVSGVRMLEMPARALRSVIGDHGLRMPLTGEPASLLFSKFSKPPKAPIEYIEQKYTVPVYLGRDVPLGAEKIAFHPAGGVPIEEWKMWLMQDLPLWGPLLLLGIWRILPDIIKAKLVGQPTFEFVQTPKESIPYLRKIGPSETDITIEYYRKLGLEESQIIKGIQTGQIKVGDFGMESHFAWETIGRGGYSIRVEYAGGRLSGWYNFMKGYPTWSQIEAELSVPHMKGIATIAQSKASSPFDVRIPQTAPTTIFKAQPTWGRMGVLAEEQTSITALEQRFGQPYAISQKMFLEAPDLTAAIPKGAIIARRGFVSGVPTVTLGVEKGVAGGLGGMAKYEQMAVKLGGSLDDLAKVDTGARKFLFGTSEEILTTPFGQTFGLTAPSKIMTATQLGLITRKPYMTTTFRTVGYIEQTSSIVAGTQRTGRTTALVSYPTQIPVRGVASLMEYGGPAASGTYFGEALPIQLIFGSKVEKLGGFVKGGIAFDGASGQELMQITKQATAGQMATPITFVSVAPTLVRTGITRLATFPPLEVLGTAVAGTFAVSTIAKTAPTTQLKSPVVAQLLVASPAPIQISAPKITQVATIKSMLKEATVQKLAAVTTTAAETSIVATPHQYRGTITIIPPVLGGLKGGRGGAGAGAGFTLPRATFYLEYTNPIKKIKLNIPKKAFEAPEGGMSFCKTKAKSKKAEFELPKLPSKKTHGRKRK